MSSRVLVIGAGPGGLASAMRLSAAGYDVEIYEAAEVIGGRMRGLQLGPYGFDTGPTILQVPRIYRELFHESGLNLDDYVKFIKLNPNTRLRFWDDTYLDLTSDIADFKRQLAAMRPDLPDAFERWYIEHIRKNEVGYKPYLGTPVRSPLGYLRPDELAAAATFRPWESLYDHFWRFFKDERVVYAMSYPSKYLGMHPTRCSSIFSLIAYLEFADGIWHPEGGFRALAQGMARAARDLGVRIHLNSPVRQVIVEQGKARGIQLASGETIRADAVLVNADFGHAVRTLLPPEARGPYSDAKLNRMRFSCSTFMLYLGVDRRWDDLPHHQLYLSEHIRRQDRPFVDDSALDETDPPFYVCNSTPVDPGNAPDGHSTLYVLVPIPNTAHNIDWQARQQAYRDLILDRLHLLGFDNVRAHITAEACYTAQTWRDDYNVHLGAVFNLGHDWMQLGPFRPHIRHTGARNLYWIGGAVHPGSGLMTILEAARSAAHFIGEDIPLGRAAAMMPT